VTRNRKTNIGLRSEWTRL